MFIVVFVLSGQTFSGKDGQLPERVAASLHEYQIDCHHQTEESRRMIPVQRFSLEEDRRKDREDDEGDDLLDYLQLQQGERSPVAHIADAVRRNLTRIFRQSNKPGEKNDAVERPVGNDLHFLKFQMSIPSEGHEDV